MPLLHKKPFIRKRFHKDLKPTDKVFYVEATNEVFTDYDEFWERLVLLNALVWSCELTGKPNLTYQEAIESEEKAKKSISAISPALKLPFLYVSTLTKRGRINDVSDDIFNYIRDRYFVGEEVEAIVKKHWYDCKVTKVIMPTASEIEEYKKSLEDTDEEPQEDTPAPMVNGYHTPNTDDDIVVVRDDHVSPGKNSDKLKDPLAVSAAVTLPEIKEEHPPFGAVKYEVIEIEPWDYKFCKTHIVKWDQIRRPKSNFTREKCKIFTKQNLELGVGGYFQVRKKMCDEVNNVNYSDIFVGDPPEFEQTPLKKMFLPSPTIEKKEKKQMINNNYKVGKSNVDKKKPKSKPVDVTAGREFKTKDSGAENKKKEEKKKVKPILTEKEKEEAKRVEAEMKMKAQQEFRARLEKMRLERMWKKDLEKEERRLLRPHELEFRQKREDLLLVQKNLPTPEVLQCRIPADYFGDFMMVLDFVNTFAEILELSDVYPHGITFEMLENSLFVNEITGVFNDIIQLLLGAVFSLQQEEDEEVEEDTAQDMASMKLEENLESKCQLAAVQVANSASQWSQQYQGVRLQKAPLDALTMTEVLRLHILASGATNVANAVWRHMNRGGFKNTDDPGLQFKMEEPEIIKKLTFGTVFDLTMTEKIKIMSVLISQILTYASVRDVVEEKLDKLREVSHNFRAYKWALVRKEKEEQQAKKQKLKEQQMKLIEAVSKGGAPAVGPAAPAVVDQQAEDDEETGFVPEKETRSASRKKADAPPDERDFLQQIDTLMKEMRQVPLGQDRAFRRYWVFNNVPGLFIEDKIDYLGQCCPCPTPITPLVEPKDNKELLKRIREQALKNVKIMKREKELEKSSSDKENENEGSRNNAATPLKEKNPLQSSNVNASAKKRDGDIASPGSLVNSPTTEVESQVVDYVPAPPEAIVIRDDFKELQSKIFGLCSGEQSSCPAHSHHHSRPKWCYFSSPEQLDELINSLNSQGWRESELKNNLQANREKLLDSFKDFSSFVFDFTNKTLTTSDIKKALKSNLNFPPDTPVIRIFELTLRDMILEMEEKMDNGMLGRLKTVDRHEWRQAVVDGTSFSMVDFQNLDWAGKKRIKNAFGLEETKEDEEMDQLSSNETTDEATIIKELAVAILLVAQAVEAKYTKGPLSESTKLCRKREKMENRVRNRNKRLSKAAAESEESSSEDEEAKSLADRPDKALNVLRTPFERWEKSLMACTSFSQLFLHLSTLDDSIAWSRSATVKRRCRICKRSSDYENMLLCDECDGGFHMGCLKPKLTKVPEGDWFCDHCKPKQKPKSPRKQRRLYQETRDSESGEESSSEDDSDAQSDDNGDEEEEDEEEIVNEEFCSACEGGGELVLCDTCPKSFHLFCADLKKIPRGQWSCPLCKDKESGSQKPSPKSRSTTRARRKLRSDEEIEASLDKKGGDDDDSADYSPERASRSRRNAEATKRKLEDLLVANGRQYHEDAIENMIHLLMSHNDSKHFRKPLSRQENADYYVKIKKPMDLRTIKTRFNRNKYETDSEFIADVLLIFQNCQQYYKEGAPEYTSGLKLSKYFISKVRSSSLESASPSNSPPEPARKRSRR